MRDSLQIFSFLFSEWAVGESGGGITDKEHLAGNCQNRQSNPGLITVPKLLPFKYIGSFEIQLSLISLKTMVICLFAIYTQVLTSD